MKMYQISLLVTSLALVMGGGPTFAQKGRGDTEGISRKGTSVEIQTVSGVLDHIQTGPCQQTTGRAIVGTHLIIKTASNQSLNLHVGPATFTKAFADGLQPGDPITAEVFQTDKLGEAEYIVQSVRSNDKTLQARDDTLRPLWASGRAKTKRDPNTAREGYRPRRGQRHPVADP